MGIYFEEEHEKPRWDSGQAILHKETGKPETREPQKDNEAYRVQNSYGTLRYLKKERNKESGKEGFAIEAFEAPGTPIHTDKEKHLDRQTMKKIRQNDKQALFASETPLRNQALFFDMKGGKKSDDFVSYLKELLYRQGHQTIEDTFGFLDQEPERAELKALKELRPEERQDAASKRADTLNSRLHRKEAKERQLCSELQLMLDQRSREEFLGDYQNRSQNEQETEHSDSPQKRLYSDPELSESAPEGEEDTDPDKSDLP